MPKKSDRIDLLFESPEDVSLLNSDFIFFFRMESISGISVSNSDNVALSA